MLLSTEQKNNLSNQTVLIFPAQTPMLEGKELFFLFSIRQIICFLDQSETDIKEDSLTCTIGAAKWRGKNFPILSLENCLGLPPLSNTSDLRSVVIRDVYKDNDDQFCDLFALCQLDKAMRRLQLPLNCRPIAIPEIISNPSLLMGAYEMEKSTFLVVDLKKIVEAIAPPSKEMMVND